MTSSFQTNIEPHIPWLAGFLEGDGCFGIKKQQTKNPTQPSLRPYLSVQVVDQQLLEFIASLLETNVGTYTHPKHDTYKTVYRTALSNRDKLRWLLPKLMPFLSKRRQSKVHELMQLLDPTFVFDSSESIFAHSILPQPKEKEKYSKDIKILSEQELQWLTGFVEAEGHISFDRRSLIPTPGFVIQSTDQDVIAYTSLLINKNYVAENRLTTKKKQVFTLSVQDFSRISYLFPKFEMYCHGSKLPSQLMEAFDCIEKHAAWKALPSKTRPSLWPKKHPRSPKE